MPEVEAGLNRINTLLVIGEYCLVFVYDKYELDAKCNGRDAMIKEKG